MKHITHGKFITMEVSEPGQQVLLQPLPITQMYHVLCAWIE